MCVRTLQNVMVKEKKIGTHLSIPMFNVTFLSFLLEIVFILAEYNLAIGHFSLQPSYTNIQYTFLVFSGRIVLWYMHGSSLGCLSLSLSYL